MTRFELSVTPCPNTSEGSGSTNRLLKQHKQLHKTYDKGLWIRVVIKITILLSMIFGSTGVAIALELDNQLRSKIVKKVTAYATAVGCDVRPVRANMIVDLYPQGNLLDKRIAVFWDGDQECNRGSGSVGTNIAIIEFSPGRDLYVNPSLSHSRFGRKGPRYIHRITETDNESVTVIGSDDCLYESTCVRPSARFSIPLKDLGRWK
jgi:hypothetical protein